MRDERFESNLLTWPGIPNAHAWDRHLASPTWLFPSIPASRNRPTALDYKNPRHGTTPGREPPCTCMWPYENNVQRRWGDMFRPRCNPVLKLTDYHISRHVVSTFKRLTTTTTHCDLIDFSLNRRGLIQKYSALTSPVGLTVAVLWRPRFLNSNLG